jgi:hypothetical protein
MEESLQQAMGLVALLMLWTHLVISNAHTRHKQLRGVFNVETRINGHAERNPGWKYQTTRC